MGTKKRKVKLNLSRETLSKLRSPDGNLKNLGNIAGGKVGKGDRPRNHKTAYTCKDCQTHLCHTNVCATFYCAVIGGRR